MTNAHQFTLANVQLALTTLDRGTQVSQADRYLTAARHSQSAWSICAQLIDTDATPHALLFAATTLHRRFQTDWLMFTDDAQRIDAFRIPLRALAHPLHHPSALHFFARACAFAMAHVQSALRNSMWLDLRRVLADDHVRICHVMSAVVLEFQRADTQLLHRFCAQNAHLVLQTPLVMMANLPAHLDHAALRNARAAVSCLQAWQAYSSDPAILSTLIAAIGIPQIAEHAAAALCEVVGYSQTSHQLLHMICTQLNAAFHAARDTPDPDAVHHAIAEVVCDLSDANADELMQHASAESNVVVDTCSQLLATCLRASDERAFLAAADGWACWIAAANTPNGNHRKLSADQVAAVVVVLMERMKMSSLPADEDRLDGLWHCETDRCCILDLLLQALLFLGAETYVDIITPYITTNAVEDSQNALHAALVSFSVASEAGDLSSYSERTRALIFSTLSTILDILDKRQDSYIYTHHAICKIALSALRPFSYMLATSASDVLFHRTVKRAVDGMIDDHVGEESSQLLFELADSNPHRMVQFIAQLIMSFTHCFPKMSDATADFCVRAVSRVTSVLASPMDRFQAMDAILQGSYQQLTALCASGDVSKDAQVVSQVIRRISGAIHEMNDGDGALGIFQVLRPSVFTIAMQFCTNDVISPAICRLLSVVVQPTLCDSTADGARENVQAPNRSEDEWKQLSLHRLEMTMSCMNLASDCFEKSAPSGEACWLETAAGIAPHLISEMNGSASAEERCAVEKSLSAVLQKSLKSLEKLTSKRYDAQPNMCGAYVRLATQTLPILTPNCALTNNLADCTKVAFQLLDSTNNSLVRQALLWWKAVFSGHTHRQVTHNVLALCNGATAVTGRMLCTAHASRTAKLVADVLFGLAEWVAHTNGMDCKAVLCKLMTEAFSQDGVPLCGLQVHVKQMLHRQCVEGAKSRRQLRVALDAMSRLAV